MPCRFQPTPLRRYADAYAATMLRRPPLRFTLPPFSFDTLMMLMPPPRFSAAAAAFATIRHAIDYFACFATRLMPIFFFFFRRAAFFTTDYAAAIDFISRCRRRDASTPMLMPSSFVMPPLPLFPDADVFLFADDFRFFFARRWQPLPRRFDASPLFITMPPADTTPCRFDIYATP